MHIIFVVEGPIVSRSVYARLESGDPGPWFHQRSAANPRYAFDSTAGRYVVLCFFASAGDARGQAAMKAVVSQRHLFDDDRASFFGVSIDPRDETQNRVSDSVPGLRFFWDFDHSVSKLYGAFPKEAPADEPVSVRRMWVVLDPTLRVMATFPFVDDTHQAVFDYLAALPPTHRFVGFEIQAPVLILPNVFEPKLCRQLIDLYDRQGGEESGFMRDVDGKTVYLYDHAHKSRKDCVIHDVDLIRTLQNRIARKVIPEIQKIHCFKATRMERYIVACYAKEDAGHFRPHRDNRTKATAHRRFAVSINLNNDFEGGELGFPEYGPRRFKAPPGAAIVFSGGLLHAVSRVTSGRRYAFLPFLYDEDAAKLREDNAKFLEGPGSNYRTGLKVEDDPHPRPLPALADAPE